MKIQIPAKYKDLKLTEGQTLAVAFLYMVSNDHGFVRYNINSYDFRRIISTGKVEPDGYNMRFLEEAIHISQLNADNWLIQFRDFKREDFYKNSGKGTRRFHWATIKQPRNIAMWCYLIGLYRGTKDLINESHNLFEYKDCIPSITKEQMSFNNFMIENR